MDAWLYLLIPVAIVVAIVLGIKYRTSSRRFMVPLVGGSLGPGDGGAHYGGDHHSGGGHGGGDSGGGGDG
ncbi:MAG TPA: hypothetical protein VGV39_24825 [Mesorhizobium sp.]|jgi:uncharacterized membrane protein YgcG|uniref:hypothetical protein n=1 Tax=Mesorhizobium sp. TaxID=1871066 RepID=UPI002DDCE883|nr:hypothetical protein [Mesorhizobium sp.]HEV2506323.1 hypothetical protein [Mesorhizobium sp.]